MYFLCGSCSMHNIIMHAANDDLFHGSDPMHASMTHLRWAGAGWRMAGCQDPDLLIPSFVARTTAGARKYGATRENACNARSLAIPLDRKRAYIACVTYAYAGT